jgi:hypothetical protein
VDSVLVPWPDGAARAKSVAVLPRNPATNNAIGCG